MHSKNYYQDSYTGFVTYISLQRTPIGPEILSVEECVRCLVVASSYLRNARIRTWENIVTYKISAVNLNYAPLPACAGKNTSQKAKVGSLHGMV